MHMLHLWRTHPETLPARSHTALFQGHIVGRAEGCEERRGVSEQKGSSARRIERKGCRLGFCNGVVLWLEYNPVSNSNRSASLRGKTLEDICIPLTAHSIHHLGGLSLLFEHALKEDSAYKQLHYIIATTLDSEAFLDRASWERSGCSELTTNVCAAIEPEPPTHQHADLKGKHRSLRCLATSLDPASSCIDFGSACSKNFQTGQAETVDVCWSRAARVARHVRLRFRSWLSH